MDFTSIFILIINCLKVGALSNCCPIAGSLCSDLFGFFMLTVTAKLAINLILTLAMELIYYLDQIE